MAKSLAVAATAIPCNKTPFLVGREATAVNFTASAVQLTGSSDNSTFTNLVLVPAGGMADIPVLPKYVKGTASTIYLIGGV